MCLHSGFKHALRCGQFPADSSVFGLMSLRKCRLLQILPRALMHFSLVQLSQYSTFLTSERLRYYSIKAVSAKLLTSLSWVNLHRDALLLATLLHAHIKQRWNL